MVKITIKKKDLPVSGSEESEENDSGASDEESSNSRSSFRKAGRSKRKCVVNFEKKKAKTLRPSKSRSKSVTPENDDEDDDEEEDENEEMELEERPPKQMFSCDLCSKAFHSKFMMRTHLKAHKKIEENSKCDKYYHYYLNSLN